MTGIFGGFNVVTDTGDIEVILTTLSAYSLSPFFLRYIQNNINILGNKQQHPINDMPIIAIKGKCKCDAAPLLLYASFLSIGLNVVRMLVGSVVGSFVGDNMGLFDGIFVGDDVGLFVGIFVGNDVGLVDGIFVGDDVGLFDGDGVGFVVG